MTQYIDKSAVMAEIEKRLDKHSKLQSFNYGAVKDLESLLNLLDTLEVKEVQEEPVNEDLENAANSYIDNWYKLNNLDKKSYPIDVEISKNDFKAGALWQKEHCLKELMTSDLETAADKYAIKIYNMFIKDETTLNNKEGDEILSDAFKAGAKWQKENLWKPADGDDLPEIDREVIALIDNGKVVFAHRPPEYWDGKNILTGEVTRYEPKRYGKGGWNIPDVKWWLDLDLPKIEE